MLDVKRDFGAVGDGVADDTAPFLEAIAEGGAVDLGTGNYRITQPLSANPRRVHLRGDGPQLAVIYPELPAGQYALTLGWPGSDPTPALGPFTAVSGIGFYGSEGAGQPNAIRLHSSDSSGHAHSVTIRDVSIYGFDTQVEIGNHAYLARFDRVYFNGAHTYGVKMDNPTDAGENVSFGSCVFSGGPGTAVLANKNGSSMSFSQCSFDYLKRALYQLAGAVSFTSCHFETDTTYGPGGEYVRVTREGGDNLPMTVFTGCDLHDAWTNYDCFLRIVGDPWAGGAVRFTNLYVHRAVSGTPYLVRDDGPYPSSVVFSGVQYGRGDFPTPKMRRQDGTEFTIQPAVTTVV